MLHIGNKGKARFFLARHNTLLSRSTDTETDVAGNHQPHSTNENFNRTNSNLKMYTYVCCMCVCVRELSKLKWTREISGYFFVLFFYWQLNEHRTQGQKLLGAFLLFGEKEVFFCYYYGCCCCCFGFFFGSRKVVEEMKGAFRWSWMLFIISIKYGWWLMFSIILRSVLLCVIVFHFSRSTGNANTMPLVKHAHTPTHKRLKITRPLNWLAVCIIVCWHIAWWKRNTNPSEQMCVPNHTLGVWATITSTAATTTTKGSEKKSETPTKCYIRLKHDDNHVEKATFIITMPCIEYNREKKMFFSVFIRV